MILTDGNSKPPSSSLGYKRRFHTCQEYGYKRDSSCRFDESHQIKALILIVTQLTAECVISLKKTIIYVNTEVVRLN